MQTPYAGAFNRSTRVLKLSACTALPWPSPRASEGWKHGARGEWGARMRWTAANKVKSLTPLQEGHENKHSNERHSRAGATCTGYLQGFRVTLFQRRAGSGGIWRTSGECGVLDNPPALRF